jgi:hypothetical protein
MAQGRNQTNANKGQKQTSKIHFFGALPPKPPGYGD